MDIGTDERIAEFEMNCLSEMYSENMIKEDNIECCVCLENHWGVKLPDCSHFICPKCYYKIYHYGYLSDEFKERHKKPLHIEINTPVYPYKNKSEKLEGIYNNLINDGLINDDINKNWFINENEDLYNCVKENNYVDDLDDKIKLWFKTDAQIKNYEIDYIKYEMGYKEYLHNCELFNIEMEKYMEEEDYERFKNCKKCCPLCRK